MFTILCFERSMSLFVYRLPFTVYGLPFLFYSLFTVFVFVIVNNL